MAEYKNTNNNIKEIRYQIIKKLSEKKDKKLTYADRFIKYHDLVVKVIKEFYDEGRTRLYCLDLENNYGNGYISKISKAKIRSKIKSENKKLESYFNSFKNFKLNNRTLFKSSNHTLDSRL